MGILGKRLGKGIRDSWDGRRDEVWERMRYAVANSGS